MNLKQPQSTMKSFNPSGKRFSIGDRSRTHGMFGTRFYFCYFSMKQRCEDKKTATYQRYGAKGIKLLWPTFEAFRDDMYESYLAHVKEYGERQTTIDRIDNSGHYCKENTRWATYKEQGRNKSDNTLITFQGKTQTMGQWAEELGINPGTISSRFQRKWPVEKMLDVKKHNRFNKVLEYTFKGKTQTLVQWAKYLGADYHALYHRVVTRKMPLEKAFDI